MRPPTEAASIIRLLSSDLPFCAVAEAPRYRFPSWWLEIDADRDAAALQFGKGKCMCIQLREGFVLCHRLLHLAIHFPTGVARDNEPLSGPCAGVEPGQPKIFGAMFFENCLRLLDGLDHFLGLVAFKAGELYDRHKILLGYLSGSLPRMLARTGTEIGALSVTRKPGAPSTGI